MKSTKRNLILFILCLIVVTLACSLNPEVIENPGNDAPNDVVNDPPPADPDPVEPIEEPELPADAGMLPAGFAVQRDCQKSVPCTIDGVTYNSGLELQLVSADGQNTFSVHFASGYVTHIASPVDFSNPGTLTVILQDISNRQYQIIQNGSVLESFNSTDIRTVEGVPSQQTYAFGYIPGTTTASGLSELHVSTGGGALATAEDTISLVVPVAMMANGDVYYTYEPYGIGGDIIFMPDMGLYRLPGNEEILSRDLHRLSGLSPDASMVAYGQSAGLTIKNVATSAEVVFPILASSDRGSGWAEFSPDAQRVAWMEASGSAIDGNYGSNIRVGSADGTILADMPSSEFSGIQSMIRPVGWLDNNRLLVESNPFGPENPAEVIIVELGGSAFRESINGTFVGLIYQ